MADPKWLPTTREGRLIRLVEEMAEVAKEYCKGQRFGLDRRYCPKLKRIVTREEDGVLANDVESNRESLLRELKDLKEAIFQVECDLATP